MSESNRVQRWRQQQREAGKEAWTLWLPRALKLYIEDLAFTRHCSPSELVQQALTTCYPLSPDVTDTVTDTRVTDTSQIRRMLQQELRAFFGDSPPYQSMPPTQSVTDTVPVTQAQAEALTADDPQTRRVTDTVPATLAPRERAPDVADTVSDTGQAPPPFDTAKYVLGKLCPRGHAWGTTGQSLLRRSNRHCGPCDREKFHERKQAKRQATPA